MLVSHYNLGYRTTEPFTLRTSPNPDEYGEPVLLAFFLGGVVFPVADEWQYAFQILCNMEDLQVETEARPGSSVLLSGGGSESSELGAPIFSIYSL